MFVEQPLVSPGSAIDVNALSLCLYINVSMIDLKSDQQDKTILNKHDVLK